MKSLLILALMLPAAAMAEYDTPENIEALRQKEMEMKQQQNQRALRSWKFFEKKAKFEDEVDSDESVLTPEEEEARQQEETISLYREFEGMDTRAARSKFAQTTWYECSDEITGNYSGYNCSNNRAISVILKNFMNAHMYKCVDAGLKVIGGGIVNELHITHAGITGDANHAPRSLHAENRAIDLKSLKVVTTAGSTKTFAFSGTTSTSFYSAFRNCWADIVKTYNGCPYQSVKYKTGSIGKEDSRHQHHLHTSVPYCINGAYGPYYYQR